MLKDDLLYPLLDEYAPIDYKERKIINAIISVIRNNLDECRCPDDVPKYISISREQLAELSQFSKEQIHRFLMRKRKTKILIVSKQKKTNWQNGYHINFDEVKKYNELAKQEKVKIMRLEAELFRNAKAKWEDAKARRIDLFD